MVKFTGGVWDDKYECIAAWGRGITLNLNYTNLLRITLNYSNALRYDTCKRDVSRKVIKSMMDYIMLSSLQPYDRQNAIHEYPSY